MEQAIGLRFAEIQVLEETEEFTDFPEGQTDGVNQMGNGQENFNAEFAAAENPRNFAVSIVWSSVDFVGDEDCLTGFNPPDRPDMGQVAQVGSDAPGKTFSVRLACLIFSVVLTRPRRLLLFGFLRLVLPRFCWRCSSARVE